MKSKITARKTPEQYSILHSITEIKRILLFLMTLLLLSGCASFARKDIGYAVPNGYRVNHPLPYQLMVKNFTDERPASERISGSPVGGTKSGDDWFQGSLTEEIPKMIAKDLAAANMFESSVYAGDLQNVAQPNTLYMEGKIHSFEYADGSFSRSGRYNDIHIKLSVELLDSQNNILWTSPAREALRFPSYLALHWNQSQQLGFPYLVEAFAECVNDLKKDVYNGSSKWAAGGVMSSKSIAAPVTAPQRPVQTQSRLSSVSQKWAVVIGISKYKDSRVAGLRYASADARAFYNWLVSQQGGGYAPSQVKLLLDSEATAENIRNALFNWLKQALEEDMVTIYFAGHGSPESPDSLNNLFLLPFDVKYNNIATTGFPMWDIETALKRFIKARRVVVIADACHSGGVGQSFDIARRGNRSVEINPIGAGLQNLSQVGDGIAVISASDDKQFSQEGQQWGSGHGVFTYYLLKGLNGDADYNKDGHVTLGELIPYLSEKVRRETRNAQSPTVAGKFDPALSIGP
jgi:uncharacterized caspase-like protein